MTTLANIKNKVGSLDMATMESWEYDEWGEWMVESMRDWGVGVRLQWFIVGRQTILHFLSRDKHD